jgi:hypothetical protein
MARSSAHREWSGATARRPAVGGGGGQAYAGVPVDAGRKAGVGWGGAQPEQTQGRPSPWPRGESERGRGGVMEGGGEEDKGGSGTHTD